MSTTEGGDQWRPCSSCKKPIAFGADYYVCNVSTCNRKGTKGFVFCTVSCWDAHLGVVRHRESWAVDAKAPTRAEFERSQADASKSAPTSKPASSPKPTSATKSQPTARRASRRIIPDSPPASRRAVPDATDLPKETLIVISKLKAYVKAKAGINCSDRVAGPLSDAVRRLCDEAIENALAHERKTLLDRDFKARS